MSVPERMRDSCRAVVKTALGGVSAEVWSSRQQSSDSYAEQVEAALFLLCQEDVDSYRTQVLFLKANLGSVVSDFDPNLDNYHPSKIAEATPETLMSASEMAAAEKARRKRIRELAVRDDTTILCSKCNLPRVKRLNTNRFDIDDENLGNQYENTFSNFCACRTKHLLRKANLLEDSEGDEEVEEASVILPDNGSKEEVEPEPNRGSGNGTGRTTEPCRTTTKRSVSRRSSTSSSGSSTSSGDEDDEDIDAFYLS